MESATLTYQGKSWEIPMVIGSEKEIAIDIAQLRAQTGLITIDEGYANTASCLSAITFVDGENGILRYRGYPIEQLAEHSSFIETAYLLIFGELPKAAELAEFRKLLSDHEFIHEDLRYNLEGFPPSAPPMAILSAMINAIGCFQLALMRPNGDEHYADNAARMMSKVRSIAAASYKKSIGRPMIYPRYDLPYTANFLHMMFSLPNKAYEPDPDVVGALDQILILHADHEQNCSTSSVRMVGSARASLWASVAAGVCALWGPLHGGANVEVIEMLMQIKQSGQSVKRFLARVKDERSKIRLMGFGHRVYKDYDPRAKFIKRSCHKLLNKLGIHDPLLEIAMKIEDAALKDPYFIERRLYPNVDFYSGIILRGIGIPLNMFTVIFAIGRIPGWIANWREIQTQPASRIYRPRQVYAGAKKRDYIAIEMRR